jgi:hypothetical protein
MVFAVRQFRSSLGESPSVNGFITKVARFTVSKAGAFSYAVAVGVAGNLIFHFVTPRDPGPTIIAVPPAAPYAGERSPGSTAASTVIAPKPAISPLSPPAHAAPASAMQVQPPTAPAPAVATPAALPLPAPKPTPPAPAAEPAVVTTPAPPPNPPAATETAVKPPGPANLEPGIAAEPSTLVPAAASIARPAPSEPIPLLPTKERPEPADTAAIPAKPAAPGPGSGGLY